MGLKSPARIFTCSMGDFWGPEIQDAARAEILEIMWEKRDCRFLILTKRPENIREPQDWTYFPPNLWQGVTVDIPGMEYRINELTGADVDFRFVSFEPLLGEVDPELCGIDWVIIGAQTNPPVLPDPEWVKLIVDQADDLRIPVFMKNNLGYSHPKREFPKGLILT
jgi:protein gp37